VSWGWLRSRPRGGSPIGGCTRRDRESSRNTASNGSDQIKILSASRREPERSSAQNASMAAERPFCRLTNADPAPCEKGRCSETTEYIAGASVVYWKQLTYAV